jgi:hypothetical protein
MQMVFLQKHQITQESQEAIEYVNKENNLVTNGTTKAEEGKTQMIEGAISIK